MDQMKTYVCVKTCALLKGLNVELYAIQQIHSQLYAREELVHQRSNISHIHKRQKVEIQMSIN